MKRLINAECVLNAHKHHEHISVDSQTIVTAAARDLAQELGVHICSCQSDASSCQSEASCCCKKTQHEHQAHSCAESQDADLNESQIYQLLKAALDAGLWTEEEMFQALKSLV